MRPTRIVTAVGLFAAAFALVGCGSKPKLVPVTGNVTHKGKAVTGGSVWFHPEGGDPDRAEKMSGQLQFDGTFTARTFPHGDGIPPGKYKVTLSPDLAGRAGVPQYGDANKTPWSVDVPDAGLADHRFEIK
jgi:hypothetical protein